MGRRALSAAAGRRAGGPVAGVVAGLLLVTFLASCGGSPSNADRADEPVRPTAPRVAGPLPAASATPLPAAGELMARAVCWYDDPGRAAACVPPPREALEAIAAMGTSGARELAAPLVDMRALDVGWAPEVDAALATLTGERLASEAAWYQWLGAHPGPLPPGYLGWKGRLLAVSDATFARVLTGPVAAGVRPELLAWTGLRVGELPRLDEPRTAGVANHGYLENDDVVFGLQVGSTLWAYPRRLLTWHPVVQDRVGGARLLVTYCGPCEAASAFTPIVGGRALQFLDAGLWLDGRPLIVDEQTASLWDAVSGRALLGTMAAAGARLPRVGLVSARWEEWSTAHPATSVLALDTGFTRDYTSGSQRARDATLGSRFPRTTAVDGRLPPDARVVGVEVGTEARAYAVAEVQERRIVLDTLGGERVLLVSQGPGRTVRVFRSGALELRELRDDDSAVGSDGREGERWWIRENAIVSQLDGRVHEAGAWMESRWDAWSAAHPGASVWGH